MNKLFSISLIGSIALSSALYAKSVTATYSYSMGDNDTKLAAKKVALAEAKRVAIEKIGVWITSNSEIENGELTQDKIASYVSGFAQTSIISEKFNYPTYTVTVEMNVNEEELRARLPKKKKEVLPVAEVQKEEVIVITKASEPITIESEVTDTDSMKDTPITSRNTYHDMSNTSMGIFLSSGTNRVTISADNGGNREFEESIGGVGLLLDYGFDQTHHFVLLLTITTNTLVIDSANVDHSVAGLSLLYKYQFETYANFTPEIALGFMSANAEIVDNTQTVQYSNLGTTFMLSSLYNLSSDGVHQLNFGFINQTFVAEDIPYEVEFNNFTSTINFNFEESLSQVFVGYKMQL
jgi:hypothetical protein